MRVDLVNHVKLKIALWSKLLMGLKNITMNPQKNIMINCIIS